MTVSFRDPAGRISVAPEGVFRSVNPEGIENLRACLQSLTVHRMLEHRSIVTTKIVYGALDRPQVSPGGVVVEHERIPFASYAHEWPAEMLLAAGELTLAMCEQLVDEGLGLKDATPHNTLFRGPRPVFVDVLSIERRQPRDPIWLADAQFARNFLIPLLLQQRRSVPLDNIFLSRRDGITPTEAEPWLPRFRRWLPPYLSLITLPARLARLESPALYRPHLARDADQARFILAHRFRSLRRSLNRLKPKPGHSEWSRYEEERPSYTTEQHEAKMRFVAQALDEMRPQRVLDVGANTGQFSLLAAARGASVVAIDRDPASAGALWKRAAAADADILPLVVDFARPTPALGWRCAEQPGFLERARGHFDCVMLLAVAHHLMVTDQIPLAEILDVVMALGPRWLVLEYVGPSDPMFRRLARGRDALYTALTQEAFEEKTAHGFETVRSVALPGADRRLYLLRRHIG